MTSTKITEADISKLKVASLPSRPTAPKSFGGSGFTASEMKAAFDRLPLYIISRYNELMDDLTREGEDGIAGAIPSGIKEEHTLADMLSDVGSGAFASYLSVLGSSLTETVSELREKIRVLTLGAEDSSSTLARLDALESTLLAEIEAACIRISELSDSLDAHKNEAEAEKTAQDAAIGELDGRVDALELVDAGTRLDGVDNDIKELSERLDSYAEDDFGGRLLAVEDNVISLDQRVTDIENGDSGAGSEAIAALAAEIKNPTDMTIDCGGPLDLA